MPRYFFNTFDGEKMSYRDQVGEDLPSRAAAWETATRYAADCLRDLDGRLRANVDWRLEVVGENKARVFVITIHADEPAGGGG
jgi:uncharacterized protein DUF6894